MSDSILEGFGEAVVEIDEKEFEHKLKKISPFDFANSINYTKEDLIVDERTEKEYNPFIVNRAMGFGKDTIIAGNEMNARPHLDNKLQYDFLKSVVRKAKRYNKWLKICPILIHRFKALMLACMEEEQKMISIVFKVKVSE